MKATDLLRQQHREVEKLFGRLEGPVGAAEAEAVLREIATVLGAHMLIEQEIFYPACAIAMDDRNVVRHSFQEHVEAGAHLRQLLATTPDDPAFMAMVTKLRDEIVHHATEEEQGLFSKAEPIIGDKKLELLGGQMEARFDEGVEFGYQVTTAEESIDIHDIDRALAQYTPTGERMVPKSPGDRKVTKIAPAAVRHAAARVGYVSPTPKGNRRSPNSGAEGARKTREGNR